MTKLANLHSRLKSLRRRRQTLRWSTGYSALAIAVLWILVGAFLVDFGWARFAGWADLTVRELNRPQRIILLAIGVGMVVWAFRRYTRPWLGASESELDMALMVERQKHIDTDLVAALQFESPEAPAWGSVQLEDAVIENTARLSTRLDVMEGLPRKQLSRRTAILLGTTAIVAVAICFRPDYAVTFLHRLLLGSRHYPTATTIETVAIDGRVVEPDAESHAAVEGRPIRFEVVCSGRVPDEGRVELEALRGGGRKTIALRPSDDDPAVFFGEHDEGLSDPVLYRIFLGDAWTRPAELRMVPLPAIVVILEVTPPEYAAGPGATAGAHVGVRQISAIEGSRVRIGFTTDKELDEATLTIGDNDLAMSREPAGEAPEDRWGMDPEGTALAAVVDQTGFAIQVTDTDGLQLADAVQGTIRIEADRAPRVSAGILTEYIVPTARPTVTYDVRDDYGVAAVSVLREIVHVDGRTEKSEVSLYELADGQNPETIRKASRRLDLSGLNLVKGDRLRITVRGVDYRGSREGKASLAETLVFQVTDIAGILAAIGEADKQAAREFKEMIRRQIDVGDEP